MRTKKLVSIIVMVVILAFAHISYYNSVTLSDKTNSYLGGMKFHRAAAGLQEGFQIAQQENKPVLVYFWASWCMYCARFATDTLENPEIKNILEKDYVLVAMDLDVDREVAQQYGVNSPPYLVLMDTKGNILERVPGAVEPGYLLPIVTQVREMVRGK
jgi:thioredoxin-related protein